MEDDQTHIGLFEFDLVFFDILDLDRGDAVAFRQFPLLVASACGVRILRTDIVNCIIEVCVALNRILLKEVPQVLLGGIMGCREVFCKKGLDSQRVETTFLLSGERE